MASLLAGSSGSKARFDKLAPEVRVRLATSEAERMEAEIHVEEMEEEIENLKEHLDTIEKVIGKSSGGSLLPNRGVVEAAVAASSAKGGKGGEKKRGREQRRYKLQRHQQKHCMRCSVKPARPTPRISSSLG